jgi:hypothetical protein
MYTLLPFTSKRGTVLETSTTTYSYSRYQYGTEGLLLIDQYLKNRQYTPTMLIAAGSTLTSSLGPLGTMWGEVWGVSWRYQSCFGPIPT